MTLRDLLPREVEEHSQLVEKMLSVFEARGYSRVMTPTLEIYDTISQGMGERLLARSFKLLDSQGRLMILRSDMTTPIARMVATSYAGESAPLTFFYYANIFRIDQHAGGGVSEFYQLGAELIGQPGAKGDTEIVQLALEVLQAAGLPHFYIDVGDVGIVQSLLAECQVPESVANALKENLISQDYVAFRETMSEPTMSKETKKILTQLPNLRGGVEMLRVAKSIFPRQTREKLEELTRFEKEKEKLGSRATLHYDLSLLKDLDYYTGIVFDCYADGVPAMLGGGGRYDKLVERFGAARPATGFALRVDRLLQGRGAR